MRASLTMRLAFRLLVLLAALAASTRARADAVAQAPDAVRVTLSGGVGYSWLNRTTTEPASMGGVVVGGDLHVHPYSAHGFYLDYSHPAGLFGPDVNVVSTGYSLALFETPRLRDTAGFVLLDVGPALGVVTGDGLAHTVLGGRVGAEVGVRLLFFTLGLSASYQGGVPWSGVPDAWESAVTAMVKGGIVVDLARRPPEGPRGPE
jgi:hypothetical protein